tara:strand:+ start:120 stop:971 length:852 start_codon:yes stop_codon:yes gene_type:complete
MNGQNYLSKYAKSFNWAGFFLPKQVYTECSNLYDFCRYLDNIADDKGDLETKLKNFTEFKQDFKKKNGNNQIIKNIWELINKFKISPKIIDDLFDGVETDIKSKVELETEKDLFIYSYRVAGTVGLMMAKVLNVREKSALLGAIDLGIAMQLTNISRDVLEDEKNGRFYIKKNFDEIKKTLKIAEKFYENSFISIKKIPFFLRFSILVARRIYRQIGYEILKKKDFESYKKSGKIYVNNLGKIIHTLLSISDLIKLFFEKDDKKLTINEHEIIRQEIQYNERF